MCGAEFIPRGGGPRVRTWPGTMTSSPPWSPLVLSLVTCFPNSRFHQFSLNGDVERRPQAPTNGDGTGDRARLAGCMLLKASYQWEAAVNRDRLWCTLQQGHQALPQCDCEDSTREAFGQIVSGSERLKILKILCSNEKMWLWSLM